jgi:hypothetical protein
LIELKERESEERRWKNSNERERINRRETDALDKAGLVAVNHRSFLSTSKFA